MTAQTAPTAVDSAVEVRVVDLEPLCVTVAEAARLLSISTRSVHRLIKSQELKCVRIGPGNGSIRVPVTEIKAYVDAQAEADLD